MNLEKLIEGMALNMQRHFEELYVTSTSAEPARDALTADDLIAKIEKVLDELPAAPPKVQFAADHIFPQDHYADDVAIIPHHPLHRAVSKLFGGETATVMRDGARTRPDGTCYRVGDTVFVPDSFRHAFEK